MASFPFAETDPAVFSEEAGLGLVEDELRGVTNADYEKGLRRTDVQYTAGGRPAVPERISTAYYPQRIATRTGVSKLGIELALNSG